MTIGLVASSFVWLGLFLSSRSRNVSWTSITWSNYSYRNWILWV